MIYDLKTFANFNISEINPPVPEFFTVPGVKIKKRVRLALKDVHVDDLANKTRLHGTSTAAVETLEKSLSEGWNSSEYLPCVRKMPEGSAYEYELVYGFHRCEALENLFGSDFVMHFDVIECSDSDLYDVRVIENEGLPKHTNKEIDIKNTIMMKIADGFLKRDEEEIKEYIKKVCFFRSQQSQNSILNQVKEAMNIDDKFIEYSESKAKRWVKNHSKKKYKFGGELIDGVHTYLCKQGYHYRVYHRMIRQHLKTGNPCQVVFHVGRPTEKMTAKSKRQATLESWYEGINNMKQIGLKTDFMKVAGFLPQVADSDEWHSLVQVK